MKVIERLIAVGRARPGGFVAGAVRVTDPLIATGRARLGGFVAGGDAW
ncbi:hypothetical protein [Streptomyces sp. Root369]|nr:hypothetical protein [Streptomyces sp. Root369]